ncbi:MAG: hypothetical protein ABWY01_05870 [Pseudoxanthomonas sp.]
MKTSTYNAWWREMGAISRGMMFIEGNVATPAALDPDDRRPAWRPSHPRRRPARNADPGFSFYEDLLFLGGRPMTAGHNEDTEEPFPQTGAEVMRSTVHPAGNNGAALTSHAAGYTRSRHLLQAIALLLLAAATAWAFGPAPSAPTRVATATAVPPPANSVRPAVAPLATRIVDLPAVTVRPQPEDYALLSADGGRADCGTC